MSLKDLIPFNRGHGNVPVRRRTGETHPFLQLHEGMNRLFEELMPEFFGTASGLLSSDWAFSPEVSVKEKKKEIEVRAEIPGVTEDDVDVHLEDNVLTLSGEKREETTKEEGGRHYSECRYGSFHRSIPLSAEVDAEKVEATFKNGVLTVRLPKVKESEPRGRRIDVNAA